jgi:hypothetical protein
VPAKANGARAQARPWMAWWSSGQIPSAAGNGSPQRAHDGPVRTCRPCRHGRHRPAPVSPHAGHDGGSSRSSRPANVSRRCRRSATRSRMPHRGFCSLGGYAIAQGPPREGAFPGRSEAERQSVSKPLRGRVGGRQGHSESL